MVVMVMMKLVGGVATLSIFLFFGAFRLGVGESEGSTTSGASRS